MAQICTTEFLSTTKPCGVHSLKAKQLKVTSQYTAEGLNHQLSPAFIFIFLTRNSFSPIF